MIPASATVETGYILHVTEDERTVLKLALRDFVRDIAGPGNEDAYHIAALLERRIERGSADLLRSM